MKQTAYLSLTILLMILGITTQGQTQAFNNTKALNTEIIKDYLVWEADNTLPEAMEHCPYFTDNFKQIILSWLIKHFISDLIEICMKIVLILTR